MSASQTSITKAICGALVNACALPMTITIRTTPQTDAQSLNSTSPMPEAKHPTTSIHIMLPSRSAVQEAAGPSAMTITG